MPYYSNELKELDNAKVRAIAEAWVRDSANVKSTDQVMIYTDIGGRQLAKEVAQICSQKGCRVFYRIREMQLDEVILKNSSRKDIERYYQFLNNETMCADVVFIIRAVQDVHALDSVPQDKMSYYSTASKPVLMDYRVNNTNWNLIYWPTQQEAEVENIAYDDYINMFFEASNQDWKAISEAHKILIDILNEGKELILIADSENPDHSKRTYLTMSIEGKQFLNSTIKNNFPGSEVFSSPVKDSVEGQIFCSGVYEYSREGVSVEDMLLTIKSGKIVDIKAKNGLDKVTALFNRDEGASYFGEVAFGTNPGLRRRVFNPLLNEKVGGSFHITPGAAYEDEIDPFTGKLVHIDNGNRSKIHWDMTIMMLPAYGGGEVKVDGKTIQKDGKFLLDGLEILNKGL